MIDCCQETASIRSTSQQYHDLETILNNLPYQPAPKPTYENAPKMNISLDLPGYAEYLPTYWPGQKITGEVKIQLNNSPIKVTHLRIALFGNVQVYGNHPGHPMTNGLFDYQKNKQLINTGLRIVRRSAPHQQQLPELDLGDDSLRVTPSPQPAQAISPVQTAAPAPAVLSFPTIIEQDDSSIIHDDNSSIAIGDERRWRLYCRRDDRGGTDQLPTTNNNKKRSRNKKTSEDRHIEMLIRRVAAIDHTTNVCSGILNDTPFDNKQEESSAFELNANSTIISFSIRVPTSRRLSGTFDHPHYPISYRVVAIMKCQDKENNELTCYSTVRLRLEPFVDIHAPQFNSRIQSKLTRHYVSNSNSILNGAFTFVLSSSSVLTFWLHKLTQQKNKRVAASDYFSSYLQSHLELPKQAFERSQYLPLELKFVNHADPNFKISAIKIYVEFVRRINMTCSMNEEVEGTALKSATVVFKSSEEEQECNSDDIVFFKHASMCFDLSKLIQAPDDCTCTIASESTRDVFSLGYDLIVRMDITGIIQNQDKNSNTLTTAMREEEPHYYYASDKHLLQQQDNVSLPKEPYHHKFKTYTLHLEPLTVVIGNSGYQNNIL